MRMKLVRGARRDRLPTDLRCTTIPTAQPARAGHPPPAGNACARCSRRGGVHSARLVADPARRRLCARPSGLRCSPATAVTLLLAAAASRYRRPKRSAQLQASSALALAVLAVGIGALGIYATGMQPPEARWLQLPAPQTATCFVLIGLGASLINRTRGTWSRVADLSVVILIGFRALPFCRLRLSCRCVRRHKSEQCHIPANSALHRSSRFRHLGPPGAGRKHPGGADRQRNR